MKIALFLILVMTQAFAGIRAGNGGDVVICGDEVKLLDRFEAEMRGEVINLPGDTLREKFNSVFDKLLKLHQPGFMAFAGAKVFLDNIEEYEATGNLNPGGIYFVEELANIKDSFEKNIPESCSVEQLVVHYNRIEENSFKGETFDIKQSLWDRLSLDDKVMTIFHEIFYQTFRLKAGDETSIRARRLNAYFSTNFVTDTKKQFYKYLEISERSSAAAGFTWILPLPYSYTYRF